MRGLNDICEFREGRMHVGSDARLIDDLIKNELAEVQKKDWAVLFRHKETREFWDLTYPQSQMHGGGPRRLRIVSDPDRRPY